jgi:hypothetical protein
MVNMVDGVTSPVLNPGSFSHCGGLYEVGHCRAADTCQKTTDIGVFFEFLAKADSEAYHYICHCSLFVFLVLI